MPSTTRLGIPYPALTDAADVPADMHDLASNLDSKTAIFGQGTFATRPVSSLASPGVQGRFYFATDTSTLYYDTGTGWSAVTPPTAVADGPAATATLRSLGTGALQAAAGNDSRLSDQRVPQDGSVTAAKVSTGLKPSAGASGGTEALRALGTSAGQAAAGQHKTQHQYGGADQLDIDQRQILAQPHAEYTASSPFSVPSGTGAVVNWTGQTQRGGLIFDGTHPSRMIAPQFGVYLVGAQAEWQLSASGNYRTMRIMKNGSFTSDVDQRPPTGGGTAAPTNRLVRTLFLSAGDYIEIAITHDTGGSLTAQALGWMTKIGN